MAEFSKGSSGDHLFELLHLFLYLTMANKKNWIGRLLLELITIFVGVYLAFELNRYQDGQRSNEIKFNYFKSFQSELSKLGAEIRLRNREIETAIESFEKGIQNGQKPTPKPLNLYFSAEMLITEAGFNDDVFMQLDPGLASSLSGGYDYVRLVERRISDFNQICNRMLILNTTLEFYDSGGNLKPEYDWYLLGLKETKEYLETLSKMIIEQATPAVQNLVENLE